MIFDLLVFGGSILRASAVASASAGGGGGGGTTGGGRCRCRRYRRISTSIRFLFIIITMNTSSIITSTSVVTISSVIAAVILQTTTTIAPPVRHGRGGGGWDGVHTVLVCTLFCGNEKGEDGVSCVCLLVEEYGSILYIHIILYIIYRYQMYRRNGAEGIKPPLFVSTCEWRCALCAVCVCLRPHQV